MKNWDLEWARGWAGLSQAKAAELLGVSKKTWGRWESGSHPTPTSALTRLKELTAMPPEVAESRLRYDREGYPFGYGFKRFQDEAVAAADARGDDTYDEMDATRIEEATLRPLEGGEYEDRARERYRLLMLRIGDSPATIATELARYDAETEQLEKRAAAGAP